MKNATLAVLLLAGTLISSSCSLFGGDKNDIGGSTDVPFAQTGTEMTLGTMIVGSSSVPVNAKVTVVSNDKGEGKAKVEFNVNEIANTPDVKVIADYILNYVLPNTQADASGKVTAEVGFKATEEGMLDYIYGDPFIIVKYGDGVGTTYSAKTPTGVEQTREIVAKSTTDDFPYGFMYIKTSKVEQELNAGGVRKMTYYANHKFGLVYWEVSLDDGSKVGSYLYSSNN